MSSDREDWFTQVNDDDPIGKLLSSIGASEQPEDDPTGETTGAGPTQPPITLQAPDADPEADVSELAHLSDAFSDDAGPGPSHDALAPEPPHEEAPSPSEAEIPGTDAEAGRADAGAGDADDHHHDHDRDRDHDVVLGHDELGVITPTPEELASWPPPSNDSLVDLFDDEDEDPYLPAVDATPVDAAHVDATPVDVSATEGTAVDLAEVQTSPDGTATNPAGSDDPFAATAAPEEAFTPPDPVPDESAALFAPPTPPDGATRRARVSSRSSELLDRALAKQRDADPSAQHPDAAVLSEPAPAPGAGAPEVPVAAALESAPGSVGHVTRRHSVPIPLYRAHTFSGEEMQRLWSLSDGISSIMSREPRVTQAVNKMVLTRDKALDYEQRQRLEHLVSPYLGNAGLGMRPDEASAAFGLAYDELIGLGPLGVPWRDDEVVEIMVDSWDRIVVERDGRLMETNLTFRNPTHAEEVARNLAQLVSDRALSPNDPLVTASLDKARVNLVYGSAVVGSGIAITLRKSRPLMDLDRLLDLGSLTVEMAEFLADAVAARATTMIVGGTGVGKTTLLNALSEFIPEHERIISIEDTFELQMKNRFWVRLQTKERASADDKVLVDQSALVRNALRMRPDRIVVGEIRDDRAAVDMLTAANTGHEGTLSTIHANSPEQMLNDRLAQMVRAGAHVPDDIAKSQIRAALDVVVQGTRVGSRRFISHISVLTDDSLQGNQLVPFPLFVGTPHSDGSVTYRRVGSLDSGADIVRRMREAGIDPSRWIS
jgi:pilus assembly protein CpaF